MGGERRKGRKKQKKNRTKKNVCSSDAVMLPSLRGMMVCDESETICGQDEDERRAAISVSEG